MRTAAVAVEEMLREERGRQTDTVAPLPVREENVDFWMVWTKTGRSPRFTHNTEEAAVREAQRLALKHPGKKFIVLWARRKFSARQQQPEAPAEMAVA